MSSGDLSGEAINLAAHWGFKLDSRTDNSAALAHLRRTVAELERVASPGGSPPPLDARQQLIAAYECAIGALDATGNEDLARVLEDAALLARVDDLERERDAAVSRLREVTSGQFEPIWERAEVAEAEVARLRTALSGEEWERIEIGLRAVLDDDDAVDAAMWLKESGYVVARAALSGGAAGAAGDPE